MRPFLLLLLLFLSSHSFSQDRDRDAILGEWVTAGGESRVEIYRADSVTLSGKIVWLRDPLKNGIPVVDDKNPVDTLKSRPVLGLVILRGFTYDGDQVWSGGKIYDPKSGNDYSAKMTLVDDQNLDLRGYVMIPLFGRTEKWTRPVAH
ncbi:MAG TPA: DUF2147 domain-containing protein [Bacteroidota bacterium]|nr:DUF2147 domain-containing protein [Bacteroidota bacterium]